MLDASPFRSESVGAGASAPERRHQSIGGAERLLQAGDDERALLSKSKMSQILIVDDSLTNLAVLRGILNGAGLDHLEANNGVEAIEIVRSRRPDLVLLDIMMPEMDGFEACERIRSDPECDHIPILFLSALGDPESKIRGLELGAADYITKPFDQSEVLARIRVHLQLKQLRQSLEAANRQLREQQAAIQSEIAAAAWLQRSLLPPQNLELSGFRVGSCYLPCHDLAGDTFNLVEIGPHHMAFYMVDVSGHGVPSALVSFSVAQRLSPSTGLLTEPRPDGGQQPRVPSSVLEHLDREYPHERFDKHLTMFYGVLDTRDGSLTYSSAGHPPPLLIRTNGTIERLDKGGPVIGLGPVAPWEVDQEKLEAGDRLCLYTDGITEAKSGDGELLGVDGLQRFLLEAQRYPAAAIGERLEQFLDRHQQGTLAADDISLLILERTSG